MLCGPSTNSILLIPSGVANETVAVSGRISCIQIATRSSAEVCSSTPSLQTADEGTIVDSTVLWCGDTGNPTIARPVSSSSRHRPSFPCDVLLIPPRLLDLVNTTELRANLAYRVSLMLPPAVFRSCDFVSQSLRLRRPDI